MLIHSEIIAMTKLINISITSHISLFLIFISRGVTPRPRYEAAAALCWSSPEEIAHVQGKRNPSKMVGTEREDQRADRLKPQSQTTSQSDHTDHSLA